MGETAGMSSDIAASETTSETTDETDTSPTPEPLATEATAATTSVGVWVGVGVGSLALVMLVAVYVQNVQRANQVGIAGGPATGSNKYRGYKKVDSLRFSSNIAF